jgi:hypothetical protein
MAPRFQPLICAASVRTGVGGFGVAEADDITMVTILFSPASNETVEDVGNARRSEELRKYTKKTRENRRATVSTRVTWLDCFIHSPHLVVASHQQLATCPEPDAPDKGQ